MSIYGSRFFRSAYLPVDTPRINRRGKSDASRELVFRDKYINARTRGGTVATWKPLGLINLPDWLTLT